MMRGIIQQIMVIHTYIVAFMQVWILYLENIIVQKIIYKQHFKIQIIIQNYLGFQGGSYGGKYSAIKTEAREELKKNNIAYLDWNAVNNDSAGAKTKEELIENVKNTVGNKHSVVILMHDAGNKTLTYETLPDIINYFKENGYIFKTIYDIL